MKKSRKNSFKTPVEFLQDLQEISEVKDYCAKQYEVIITLQADLKASQEENVHLKQLLTSVGPSIITSASNVSEEELIYLTQIQRLKKASDERELTLDEVKKLDLLNKNKHLTKEKTTIDVTPKKQAIPTAKLLALASRPSNDDE